MFHEILFNYAFKHAGYKTIHRMKYFVLFFLLLSFMGFKAEGQKTKAKEIVAQALKVHTSGKIMERFEVKIVNDMPGKAPASLQQPDPMMNFLDSLMKTLPDSMRKEMADQKVKGEAELFKTIVEEYEGKKYQHFIDIPSKKVASKSIRLNRFREREDTTASLHNFEDSNNLIFACKINPVLLLQVMNQDSAQLHYTGKVLMDDQDYLVVQVKLHNKWLEVYIDARSKLVSRLVTSMKDEDPLMGQRPLHYKNVISYKNYKLQDSFLLPNRIEETDSHLPFTDNKLVTWISINKVFPASVFDPPLPYEEKISYLFYAISDNLFLMEERDDYTNSRSIISMNPDKTISIFTNLANNEIVNKKKLKAITTKFGDIEIKSVYSLSYLSGLISLSCFFSKQIQIAAPKATGIFGAVLNSGNREEDSMKIAVHEKALLKTFDQDFETQTEKVFILNPGADPEQSGIRVAYYLEKEHVVYLEGYYPHQNKNKEKWIAPGEKALLKLIENKALEVEKIIFSGSFVDNAPLFMTYADFENRVKN
ncbi:hypothetical protein SAMN04487995_3366 [Dyadobacter koreensis]|uniref:Uncharacterized protein n=2 Tax=Dyadobacter koreensis TaxID=408657 RepID=A0A1H6W7F7_9BACT|nr:hypothetical protein SAMN04487995_3366 [Dyadobacter koreensis]